MSLVSALPRFLSSRCTPFPRSGVETGYKRLLIPTLLLYLDLQLLQHIISKPQDIVPLLSIGIADTIAAHDLAASNEQFKSNLLGVDIDGEIVGMAIRVLQLRRGIELFGQLHPMDFFQYGLFRMFLQIIKDLFIVRFTKLIDDVLFHFLHLFLLGPYPGPKPVGLRLLKTTAHHPFWNRRQECLTKVGTAVNGIRRDGMY